MADTQTQADEATAKLIEHFSNAVSPFIEKGAPFALLDYPDHPNVGDSAIYAGEIEFFDKHVGRPPSYVCSLTTYREDVDAFCPEGPLFLHGGGNFGSVWRKHQLFRINVAERYKHRKVIQMAQTVKFADTDTDTLELTKKAIGSHPDFTLLVRDKESFAYSTEQFDCEVKMCPDAAHNMWKLTPDVQPDTDVLFVLRADRETLDADLRAHFGKFGEVTDWEPQFWSRSPMDRVIEKFIAPRLPASNALMTRRESMYRRQAINRVNYGARLLARGRQIVSDRLHVHIISSLLRKPHISLDNSYGKITRYVNAWEKDGLITFAKDRDEVRQMFEAKAS